MDRSIRGRIASAEKGKRTNFAIMPYGYKDVDGYIKVDENEAKVVQSIYNLAIQGETLRGIANHLNSLKVPTRQTSRNRKRILNSGKEIDPIWRKSTITKILKPTLYKGERKYRDLIIPIPSIVTEEEWDQVQERFKNNVGYKNRTKYEYLLKNKIKCGSCGLSYYGETRIRYGKQNSIYGGYGRRDKGIKCRNGQFKSSVLDKFVYELIFRHSAVMINIHKENLENFNLADKNQQIDYYKAEIKKQEELKKRTVQVYLYEYISKDELDRRQKEIRNEMATSEKHIKQLTKEIENFNELQNSNVDLFKKYALEENYEIRREFVIKYLDEVVLYRIDNCRIDFTKLKRYELGLDTPVPKKVDLRNPNPHNDKLMYIEIYAFGVSTPIKAVVSSVTEICFDSKDLNFKDGSLTLDAN